MKKFYGALMFLALAVFAFSLSGCGGSSSNTSLNNNTQVTETVKEVAVLSSPVFEQGKEYTILKGATLSGMKGAEYFIANVGTEANKATMNLGFVNALGNNETLAFVDNSTGKVVFAYDPKGTADTALTDGTVEYGNGGQILSYNGLVASSAAFFTSLNVDTSSAKQIVLNGNTATIDGVTVNTYDYVWHANPDHEDEYYTEGINGTTEYTEDEIADKISDTVYIAHDIVYMPSGLEYTATVKDDDETEYAAYYSSEVQAKVAADLGTGFEGPFIFATLPMTGMGGGGNRPGGDFNPGGDMPSGDRGPGGNMPSGDRGPGGNMPSGDRGPGGNFPPNVVSVSATSYNDQIASTISAMTHSAEDAYNNPVLHITEPGVYSLKGTWNGQIWVDVGSKKKESSKVSIILNGVTVSCSVAPAIVFKKAYECGHSSTYDADADDDVTASAVAAHMKADSADVGRYVMDNAGVTVVIADDTTNTFSGTNVYRMLKPEPKKDSVTKIDGTDLSQQKKRYKMDGAFYSYVSMAIGGGSKGNGVLNVSSTFEGLDDEMHLTIVDGTVNVDAEDDGSNVNEDDISVFTMLDGNVTITSQVGDGIDSNGYVAFVGGKLNITAGSQKVNSAGEAGIDSERGTYIYDDSAFTWTAINGNGGGGGNVPGGGDNVNPQPGSEDNNVPTPPGDNKNIDDIPTSEISDTPVSTYIDYVAPTDADTSMTIKTDNGITEFDMGSGSTVSFIEQDTDTSARNIPTSGSSFKLTRKVNTFWNIK